MRWLAALAFVLGCRDSSPPVHIRVTTDYSGGGATAVVAAVTAPLEAQLGSLDHVIALTSRTTRDASTIDIAFERTAPDAATDAVAHAIAATTLPRDLPAQPRAQRRSPRLARYALSGPFHALLLGDQARQLATALERIPGVAVDLCGARAHELRVMMDISKLDDADVTGAELVAKIPTTPTITADELRTLELAKRNAATIRLGDVALVEDAAVTPDCVAFAEQPIIEITVFGEPSATDAVTAAITEARRAYPPQMSLEAIPAGMHVLEIAAHDPLSIRDRIDNALGTQAHELIEIRDGLMHVEIDGDPVRARDRLRSVPDIEVVEPDATLQVTMKEPRVLKGLALDIAHRLHAITVGLTHTMHVDLTLDPGRASRLGVSPDEARMVVALASGIRVRPNVAVGFIGESYAIVQSISVRAGTGRVLLPTIVALEASEDGAILRANQLPMAGVRVRMADLPDLAELNLPSYTLVRD